MSFHMPVGFQLWLRWMADNTVLAAPFQLSAVLALDSATAMIAAARSPATYSDWVKALYSVFSSQMLASAGPNPFDPTLFMMKFADACTCGHTPLRNDVLPVSFQCLYTPTRNVPMLSYSGSTKET